MENEFESSPSIEFSKRCERCNASINVDTSLKVDDDYFCNTSCFSMVGVGNIVYPSWGNKGNSVTFKGGEELGAE